MNDAPNSTAPIVIKDPPLCAFCRHWMIGSLSLSTRVTAGARGQAYPCHVKQPTRITGIETCPYFETAEMQP